MPVDWAMLTPQGMRQRYLNGRLNRQRYIEQYQLLSPEYVPGEVFIQGTDYERVIQSGYSELMGMFNPDSKRGVKLTANQVNAVAPGGAASPPFKVRDQRDINS